MAGILLAVISCNQWSGEEKAADETASDSSIVSMESLNRQLSEDTTNARLYEQRAVLHLARQNPNKAMRDILNAIQLEPENPDFRLTLSDIYMSMGLLENCEESLDKALELDPDNTESMLKLAEINLILRNYKKAIENADRAIAVDKSDPLPHFMKGYTYAEAGDTVNAIKSYLEAVNIDQEYYDAYVQLGIIYSRAQNRLAVDYLNNALNIDPQSIEALYALGMFYQEAGDTANAIESYNKLLVVDPANVYGNYNLGYIHLVMLQQYEKAIEYFDRALEGKPDYFEAIYNKGYCYELLGNYEKARELYNRTLEIEVNYEKAIAGLNRIYGK